MSKYDNNFFQIIEKSLKNEGGYVNNLNDKGGETKFGISKRSYPDIDIKNLTLEKAKMIYKRDFWDNQKYKNIDNIEVVTKVFDMAINIGPTQAIKLLQRALKACGYNINDDGTMGVITLNAVNTSDVKCLLTALKSETANYYRILVVSNPSQNVFLKGWLTRAYS